MLKKSIALPETIGDELFDCILFIHFCTNYLTIYQNPLSPIRGENKKNKNV